MRVLAALVLASAVAVPASAAQEPSARERERRGAREEAYRMVDAYVVSHLQESLGLTDEQSSRVLPLVTRLQKDRRALAQRRVRAVMELRTALASGGATEARVAELLRDVKAAENDEMTVVRRDRDAVDAALTPLQQAKYRVLEVEVERKIRELMAQVRERRGGQRPRRQ